MKRSRKNKTKAQHRFKWELLPIIFVTCILPFLLRMEIVTTGLEGLAFLPTTIKQRADFFLFWKSRLFVVSAAIMLLILLDYFLMRGKKDKNWKQWIPLLLYEVLVILSTLFSGDRYYSLHGMTEHFETVWVLLGYGIAAYYTYIFTETRQDAYLLLGCIMISAMLQSVLGIFQMVGKDLLDTEIVKTWMVPEKYAQFRDQISFRFSEEIYQRVSTTLYNTNYAGMYFVTLLPLAIGMLREKKGNVRIFLVLFTIVGFVCMIGTGSKSAILIFFVLLAMASVAEILMHRKQGLVVLLISVGFLFLWIGYDKISGFRTMDRVAESVQFSKEDYQLEEVQLSGDKVFVTFDGKTVSAGLTEVGDEALFLDIRDQNGKELSLEDDEKQRRVSIRDKHYEGMEWWCYRESGVPYLCMKYQETTWIFTKQTEDGTMRYINIWGKEDQIEKADSIWFTGREEIFTYRGYIWGRTLALLKDYVILGSGPDTFLLVFPQNDYVMKSNMGIGFFREILSKPHSMYLQMAVQTGVLSLFLFLVWMVNVVRGLVKALRDTEERYLTAGLLFALSAYLLMGIFHDSMIVTAPIFFVLAGLAKKWGDLTI